MSRNKIYTPVLMKSFLLCTIMEVQPIPKRAITMLDLLCHETLQDLFNEGVPASKRARQPKEQSKSTELDSQLIIDAFSKAGDKRGPGVNPADIMVHI